MSTLHNFWCHQCKAWQDSEQDAGDEFACLTCGETILCDECGQPWNFSTEHEHAVAAQSRKV